MTRGTYWRCVACGFACDKDAVCPDCGYHTLVQEDFQERTWVHATSWRGLTDEDWDYLNKYCGSIRSAIQTAETLLKEKNT